MPFSARFQDGLVAQIHDVTCDRQDRPNGPILIISDSSTGVPLAQWPIKDIPHNKTAANELRLSCTSSEAGARLIITNHSDIQAAIAVLPELHQRGKAARRSHAKLLVGATAALASLILVYLFGVPLVAGQIVTILPLEWEEKLGETAATQIERVFGSDEGFTFCNTDPDSPENQALNTFVSAVLDGQDTPFGVRVHIVDSPIVNAFALPGGQIYYFSGMLEKSDSADEFAGVLAHEIGHVVHRHTMEQIVATAGTGLLVGFVLGDISGLSVAGGIGSALIDSRFSREAERSADIFAANAAHRLGFDPTAMGDLLERVAADSEFSRALSILSSHPLTSERQAMLDQLDQTGAHKPAFSQTEWAAIKKSCNK